MVLSDFAKEYHEKMFPGYTSDFLRTDPEFIEIFDNFAFDEVIQQTSVLDDSTRFLSLLAVLLGCQGIDEFRAMIPAAKAYGMSITPYSALAAGRLARKPGEGSSDRAKMDDYAKG